MTRKKTPAKKTRDRKPKRLRDALRGSITMEGTLTAEQLAALVGQPDAHAPVEPAPEEERFLFLVDGLLQRITLDEVLGRVQEFVRWWLESSLRLNDTHARRCTMQLVRQSSDEGPAHFFDASFGEDAMNHDFGQPPATGQPNRGPLGLPQGAAQRADMLTRLREDVFLHTQLQNWLKDMRQPGVHYEGATRGLITLEAPVQGPVTVRREDGRKKA